MTKSKQTDSRTGTREALLLAGERLFAENGIDAVSLRQINTAAGQRNSSAAHYHFGSKDALVRAIFDYRMERVNRNRQTQLQAALAGHDGALSVRQIVAILVNPIVDEISDSEGGSFYIRFLSQAIGHPQAKTSHYSESLLVDAAHVAYAQLRAAVRDIPEPILGQRFGLMWEMIIHSLADRERGSQFHSHTRHIEPDLFVNNLIDAATGALTAPMAADTAAGLAPRPNT